MLVCRGLFQSNLCSLVYLKVLNDAMTQLRLVQEARLSFIVSYRQNKMCVAIIFIALI